MSDQDEFIIEFLAESREGLAQLDNDLVALEEDPGNSARYDSAFRILHTIKGNAGFLDFPKLAQVAHAGENLLQRLRQRELKLNPVITDALLDTMDSIRTVLTNIEQTGTEGDDSFEVLLARLHEIETSASLDDETASSTITGVDLAEVAAEGDFDSTLIGSLPELEAVQEDLNDPDVLEQPGSAESENSETGTGHEDEEREQQIAMNRAAEDGTPRKDTRDMLPGAVGESQSKSGSSSREGSVGSSFVKVDVNLLDRLMNLVGELVLTRNQIVELFSDLSDPTLANPIHRLNSLTTDLQEGVLKTRMQQIGVIWQRYPRMVRDFSRVAGKDVVLRLEGQETELDKSLVEAIRDPLIHLIRNAVDHGIEKPHQRTALGKPKAGLITLSASHESGQVLIEISDDGSGLNLDRIRRKAIQRGLVTADQAAVMQASELKDSIFTAGFSTAEDVSSISGRGVGMDVVKTHIEQVGGTIEIDSEEGVGTTFRLTVPLTLAIIPAIIVICRGRRFAIPQTNVVEMLSLRSDSNLQIEQYHDSPVLRLRGNLLPVVDLTRQFHGQSRDGLQSEHTNVMVLKTGSRQFALVVDGIGNSEEIVVKPFGEVLQGMSLYGGATIMGDGSVALILDVRGIAQRAGLFAIDRQLSRTDRKENDIAITASSEQALLVTEISGQRRLGVSLAGVLRLEEIPLEKVEYSGGSRVLQYRGEILPLLDLEDVFDSAPTTDMESMEEQLSIVVYNVLGQQLGLIVRRVVDIADDPEPIRPAVEAGCLIGTTVALGCVTDVIDIAVLAEEQGVQFLSS